MGQESEVKSESEIKRGIRQRRKAYSGVAQFGSAVSRALVDRLLPVASF